MNTKFKKIFKYTLVIAWMIVIYWFSSDTADISNNKSGLVIQILSFVGIDVNSIFGEFAMLVVRKLGHLSEYFILCLLLINSLKGDMKLKSNYMLSLCISFLYACSDEFHQLFVPGRSGQIKDVLIDTLGALLAVIVVNLIFKVRNKKG